MDGHQLQLAKSDTHGEDYTFSPSGNEWILVVSNRHRTKQSKRSSDGNTPVLKTSGLRAIVASGMQAALQSAPEADVAHQSVSE